MITQKLSRLEKVDLRQVFNSEAADFTPWLAEPENLKLLGDTIGIELELSKQEKEVGPFRADLLCKNVGNETWVLIENQIERTDHTHLGQLLTYAAGLEAVTIVWIASTYVNEHRAAIDWLNEITGEKYAFFGLEMELYRIGESPVAPKFNIVCKPNNFSKAMKAITGQNELTNTQRLQLHFWEAFSSYMGNMNSVIRCQKPSAQNWMNHPLGIGGAKLTSIASNWNSETSSFGWEIRVELYLEGEQAKSWFLKLYEQKEAIERELGYALVWHNPENTKTSRIYIRKVAEVENESQWAEYFFWLHEHLEQFNRVFKPRLQEAAKR